MTIISITEARIRDHTRNADIYDGFAKAAIEDGKMCMATLYSKVAIGHKNAVDRLEADLKKMRGTKPLPKHPAQSENILDLGRDSLSDPA